MSEFESLDVDRVTLTDWLALAWWGVGTMAIGTVLWYRGVQRVPGTSASAFMGVMPVSAVLLSYVLLGESFEPLHAVGMAAVLAGIAAVVRSEREAGS
jgi:drug/metabolite transporter (DMT)-like permease